MSIRFTSFRIQAESWASQNIPRARFLFVSGEVFRLSIAFLLGKSLLFKPDYNETIFLVLMLSATVFTVFRYPAGRRNFGSYRSRALTLMLSSFTLAFLSGNLFSARQPVRNLISATDYYEAPRNGLLDQVQQQNTPKHPVIKMHNSVTEEPAIPTGKRLLYVLLFLVSLPLTYFGLILACTLGCNGFPVFAWLAVITSFGVFSGGIYFLIKAFRKKARPHKSLDKKGKKKEWKNFFLTWLITFGAAMIALLIGNLVGG